MQRILHCETERSLKTRFLEHKRPSPTSSKVSNHINIESPGHHIDLDEVNILDREPYWFERGAEAIYIKVNNPTLIRDGGQYKLPGVYESILRSSVPLRSQPEIDSLILMKDEGSSENSEVWKKFCVEIKSFKLCNMNECSCYITEVLGKVPANLVGSFIC